MNVEDDVLVVLRGPHPRKRRVCVSRAVIFQTAETVFQVAGVSESEGLRDFDDQGALDQLDFLRVEFGVIEAVVCTGDFA